MLYSSGSNVVYQTAKSMLSSSAKLGSRRIETSDPKEIDENYLESEFSHLISHVPEANEKMAFARPKGPNRKR
jgi:twinfilin